MQKLRCWGSQQWVSQITVFSTSVIETPKHPRCIIELDVAGTFQSALCGKRNMFDQTVLLMSMIKWKISGEEKRIRSRLDYWPFLTMNSVHQIATYLDDWSSPKQVRKFSCVRRDVWYYVSIRQLLLRSVNIEDSHFLQFVSGQFSWALTIVRLEGKTMIAWQQITCTNCHYNNTINSTG